MFAVIQYKPPKGNIPQALLEIEELISTAANNGAKLIVLPEMATTGYIWPTKEALLPFAEKQHGPTYQHLSRIAIRHDCWIICGYVEQEKDLLYNSALVIDNTGKLVCNYRKVLLYDADYTWATPGNTRFLVETPFGILAPAICMDLNDYAFVEFIWKEKPDIIAFCTNWLDEGGFILDYWKQRLSFWRGWFLSANSWGPDEHISFCGQSTIIDPLHTAEESAPRSGNHIIYAPLPSP